MILSVIEQGSLFLGTIAAGFLSAFVYDIFRTARRIIRHSSLAIHIEDIIFWIIVVLVMFWFLLNANGGEIRFFLIAGVFIGMASYVYTLSPLFMKFSIAIYNLLKKTVLLISSIIMAPIKVVLYFLSFPAALVRKKIKTMYNYEKRLYNGLKVRSKHKVKKLRSNIRIVFKKI